MSLMHINDSAAVHLLSLKEHNHLASSTTNSTYNLSHARFLSQCVVASSTTPGVNERNYSDCTDLLCAVTHVCRYECLVSSRRVFGVDRVTLFRLGRKLIKLRRF
jgi:hypothetical protein